MIRFSLLKESLLATVMILIITFGISFIPFKFEFTKGIRQEFLGFDIYDLYFSGNHLNNTQRDSNIVLVEISDNRSAIADQITILQKYSPTVIGIDAVFDKKGDSLENSKLIHAIHSSANLIYSSRFPEDLITKQTKFVGNYFEEKIQHYQSGYINLLGSSFSVIRSYPPFLKVNDSSYLAFTSLIAKMYAPEKFKILKERNKKLEIINYKGNLESYTCLTIEQLPYYDKTNQLESLLLGKIVLLGYFDKEAPLIMEDLHFSPLNEQIAGKSFPDLYGVVVHANILSMILNGNFIDETSIIISYLIAGMFTFLFLLFILSLYDRRIHPKHILLLLIQIILILLLSFIFLQIFKYAHIKVPLLPIMIALALCVELLDIYKMMALWFLKKYRFKTVFSPT